MEETKIKMGEIVKKIYPGLMKSILYRKQLENEGILSEDTTQLGNASAGLYYAPFLGGTWGFYGNRNSDLLDDQGLHGKFWEKTVLPAVVNYYKFGMSLKEKEELINKLKNCFLAFPRGRIEGDKNDFDILNGNEVPESFIRTKVIPFFKIPTNSKIVFTPHEQCYTPHKNIIRKELGIIKDWPSSDILP